MDMFVTTFRQEDVGKPFGFGMGFKTPLHNTTLIYYFETFMEITVEGLKRL